LVLDEAVILACPGLRLRNFKTVRDYFKALQKEFPEITQDIIEQYVCMKKRGLEIASLLKRSIILL
jgi:hypothetical protein